MKTSLMVTAAALAGAMLSVSVAAQDISLAGLGTGELRGAIEQRYQAALAATLDPAIVNADDARFLWAQQSKVQCAIALGYLKSSTRDETSIGKCAMAYDYMMRQPVARAAPLPPPPQTRTCPDGTQRPVTQPCPVPPPPVIVPMGERG